MSWSHVSVEEEFKKNNELKKEIFDNLKDWVEKQPHLPKMTGKFSFSSHSHFHHFFFFRSNDNPLHAQLLL